jgi:hypothetical protein
VKRWGAAKYLEEYEQNIGLTERGRGLTVFDIFVNYSAQQYCIRIRSSSYRSGHVIKKASLIGLCSG